MGFQKQKSIWLIILKSFIQIAQKDWIFRIKWKLKELPRHDGGHGSDQNFERFLPIHQARSHPSLVDEIDRTALGKKNIKVEWTSIDKMLLNLMYVIWILNSHKARITIFLLK